MEREEFSEYIKEVEPDKKYKGYAWSTAIGLQAVDGLKPSAQLYQTEVENIEGNISLSDAKKRIESYYAARPSNEGDQTEEADKVSVRIASVLSEKSFSFVPTEYIGIHRKLFTGMYKHAGKIRDYNITKSEWVLDGATVLYGNAAELFETLECDFGQEKKGLVIKDFRRKRRSNTWLILSHAFDKFIFFVKGIRERPRSFL